MITYVRIIINHGDTLFKERPLKFISATHPRLQTGNNKRSPSPRTPQPRVGKKFSTFLRQLYADSLQFWVIPCTQYSLVNTTVTKH